MLAGKDLFEFSEESMVAAGLIRGPIGWDHVIPASKAYYEKMAELVNAHFTEVPQAAVVHMNLVELLANSPDDKQAMAYQFLYKIGHRIY